MKFLCGNCKAKYQIADEKISGRTLRMKCRRCQHDIIIRGQEQAGAAAASASAAGGARGSVARRPQAPQRAAQQPRGSALGADFRRSVGGPAPKRPAPPTPPAPAELWHVAINDVPVGPIRRQEVERKIQTGAVTGDSLCWREGFDDWRPVAEIAELASLLRQQRPPAPSRRPPVGRGIGQRRAESRPRIRPSRPAPADKAPVPPPDNVVPIGGRLGGSTAPEVDYDDEATRVSDPVFDPAAAGPTTPEPAASLGSLPKPAASLSAVPDATPMGIPATEPEPDPLGDMFGPPDAQPAAAAAVADAGLAGPSLAPTPSEAPARRKRAIPIGAWIAIAAAGAFGVTLAVFVGTSLLREPQQPVAQAEVREDPNSPAEAEPALALDEVPEGEGEGEEPSDEGAEAEANPAAAGAGARPRNPRPNAGGNGTQSASEMRQLTAEQQALLDRMGGSGLAASNIDTGMAGGSMTSMGGAQLTGDQLRSTVNSNRRSLQRCYELAIRGAGEPPTIRLDVQVTIAGTGRVTRVSTSGRDFGGMKACVESNVRRWRFQAAGGTTATQFPVVFQPGA